MVCFGFLPATCSPPPAARPALLDELAPFLVRVLEPAVAAHDVARRGGVREGHEPVAADGAGEPLLLEPGERHVRAPTQHPSSAILVARYSRQLRTLDALPA